VHDPRLIILDEPCRPGAALPALVKGRPDAESSAPAAPGTTTHIPGNRPNGWLTVSRISQGPLTRQGTLADYAPAWPSRSESGRPLPRHPEKDLHRGMMPARSLGLVLRAMSAAGLARLGRNERRD